MASKAPRSACPVCAATVGASSEISETLDGPDTTTCMIKRIAKQTGVTCHCSGISVTQTLGGMMYDSRRHPCPDIDYV